MLNQSHSLYQLANKIDWDKFDKTFRPLYCHDNGRPSKPIRLMCGLLILKHLCNLSDESVVEQWSENLIISILWYAGIYSCRPLCLFRISAFPESYRGKGIELIFQESI